MLFKKFAPFRKKNLSKQLDELALAHEQHLESLSPKELEMLNNIMVASHTKVEDIMVPRSEIKFLASHLTLSEVIKEVAKNPQTRYPVYGDDPDHVIGFVNSKSIFWALQQYQAPRKNNSKRNKNGFSLKYLVRPVLFVSGDMAAFDLLSKMSEEKKHLAIVVDEYGATDGLVTVTDLAEEIIGEMDRDIFQSRKAILIETSEGFLINPMMRLDEFEKTFGVKLEVPADDIDIDTVGGVVMAMVGYVPNKGETIKTKDKKITFIVKDSTNRLIKSLLVKGVQKKNGKSKS